MTTEDKFQAAVNIIRSLPKDGPYQPSHEMMLKFYGLYKQAVEGPCTEPKPAFYEVVKGYKWQAWRALGDMTQAEAKNCYVDELKKIIETMAYTENVASFIDALGPFYEYVDVPGKKQLNNNTAKGPPSGDGSDSCNEGMESGGRNTPITNGVHYDRHNDHNHHHHHHQASSVPASFEMKPCSGAAVPLDDVYEVTTMVENQQQQQQEEEEESQDDSEEDEEDEEEEEEGTAAAAAAAAVSRVYSDSDTDEEYSEPAESLGTPSDPPLHHSTTSTPTLTPPQQLSAAYTERESHSTPQPTAPQEEAVTHGGGDKSHPGGLQMTPGQGYSVPNHSPGPSQLPLAFPSPTQGRWVVRGGSGGGGGGGQGGRGGGGGGGRVADDVNAQLMVVLHRLQTDMESVLHRLNTLETLTVTQHHIVCRACQGSSSSSSNSANSPGSASGRSWWPFPELSPRSTFFLLLWPLILHGAFRLLPLLRCRRKRS